ncbi:carbonic anhydrase 4-like, partial [Clarias magur]
MISGAGLGGNYKAVEVHFHWGKNGGPGSEHTIDGEQYPMEMHIVHIKDNYRSVLEAAEDPNGLAVLGFLYQESDTEDKKYGSIINALNSIKFPGNQTQLDSLSLAMLIPPLPNLTRYFRYDGSLTTPDCAEVVIWTVFENTIKLGKEQLKAFSSLWFENGIAMTETFRPVQPLN